MKLLNLVCAACGRTFQQRKERKFCSWSCRTQLTEWTQDQIHFHVMRAGSRKAFQAYLKITDRIMYERYNIRDIDRLLHGQMVNIGGILAKRCYTCGVTWPLYMYWSQELNKSGVAGPCENCRIEKKLKSDKEVVY